MVICSQLRLIIFTEAVVTDIVRGLPYQLPG